MVSTMSHHESEVHQCGYLAGVEEPETEAWWELPEDHVLSSTSLPDLHEAEDAEHGSSHGGKSERPAPRPVQISQRDEGSAGLPDIQIRHVLPKELRQKTNKQKQTLSSSFLLDKIFASCLTGSPPSMCNNSALWSLWGNLKTWTFIKEIRIHQSLKTQAPSLFSYVTFTL